MILDGKKTAKLRNDILKNKIAEDTKQYRAPHLAIILVGSHPASLSYIKGKLRAAESIGMKATLHHYQEDVSSEEMYQKIKALNHDQDVDGMILQLPLPKHLDEEMLTSTIDASKDADGFHVLNQGRMYQGKPNIKPATPYGMTLLLEAYNIDVKGKHAVIVGRSNIVGFPIARLLMDMGATITVCHSKTKDLAYHTKQADILNHKVKQLIELTKLEHNVTEQERQDISIREVIQHIYDQQKFRRDDVQFILDLDQSTYYGVYDYFFSAFSNIVDNMLRYAASKISITLKNNVLTFENDGEHIEESMIQTLFKPYEKGPKGQFGLGLSIVKKTMDLFQLSIEVYNTKDGVGFTIKPF